MIFKTRKAANASLREFTLALRKAHKIVRFYSTQDAAYRYTRVLTGQRAWGSNPNLIDDNAARRITKALG